MNEQILNQQSDSTGLIQSDISKEIAKIQGKMFLARQFPRDVENCMQKIIHSCQNPAIAEDYDYVYNRGGTEISGASIRLMEIVAQNWGNIDFGIRELSRNETESEMQAFAWDLQTNVSQELTFTVGHTRYSKSKGLTDLVDPRDIYEAISNYGTRRMRKCMESVIPQYVVKKAMEICDDTLRAEIVDIEKARRDLLKAFVKYGITKPHIEEKMNCRIDTLKVTQILRLRRIYKSISDGVGKPSDFFTVDKKTDKVASSEVEKTNKLNQKLKDKQNGTGNGDESAEATETEESGNVKRIQELMLKESEFKDKMIKEDYEKWVNLTSNLNKATEADLQTWVDFVEDLLPKK